MGPADWLQFLHVPVTHPERVRVLDSNLSTFTAEADRVIWVGEPEPWIELIELQSGRDLELPDRLHWYSTLLRRARKVPVHSTILLLRPAADGPDLTGVYEQADRQGAVYDWFRYNVVRIWERPVEEILAAGLPVLPWHRSRRSSPSKSAGSCWPSPIGWREKPPPSRRRPSGTRPES